MEMWRTMRRVVTLAAIVGGVWLLVIRPVERGLASTKSSVRHGLEQVLGAVTNADTRVVEGRAEIVQSSEIAELSLMEMRMSATRTVEKSDSYAGLPLGTKKLIVRGTYRVKGGYKLKEGVSLRMESGQPIARFPKPQILSVELVDYEVLTEERGWLNKVQPADRAQILRELRAQMRMEAMRSGMLDTIQATLRTRLRDLLGVEDVEIEEEIP